MGRGGIYFRQTLPSAHSRGITSEVPEQQSSRIDFKEIESGGVSQMIDSSSIALLEEIDTKAKKPIIWPWFLGFSIGLLILLAAVNSPVWIFCLIVPLCVGGLVWAVHADKMRKTVVLLYDLEQHIEEVYQNLHSVFDSLRTCARVWRIESKGNITTTYDWKVNAGASAVVKRKGITPNVGSPPYFQCNISIPVLPTGRGRLYFLPDRILVWNADGVGAISFEQFEVSTGEQRFIEEEGVPMDARVVDRTWKFVNKKGGPDRRFNNNRELPVVLYEQILLTSKSGLKELLQLSKTGLGIRLKVAIQQMGSAISQDQTPKTEDVYLKCLCNNCGVFIEFPAHGVGQTVSCPHCGLETVLFNSSSPPAIESVKPPVIPQSPARSVPPRISVSAPSPKRKAPPRWLPAGESVTVGNFVFSSGMVYVSEGEPAVPEASNINIRLPVGYPAQGVAAPLGYYSQYSFLSPDQRAAYLDWLAGGRKDEDPASRNLGYIFLFFYGLERRLLVEKGQDQEVVAEIVRLLHHYGTYARSRSLQSYGCQLVHFWGWQQGEQYYAQLLEWMKTLPVSLMGDDELAIVLASHFQSNKPLPANLAYELTSRDPMSRRSVVVSRVNGEFRELFAKRYLEQFPGGMSLSRCKRLARLQYRPASPTLLYGLRDTFAIQVPDVLGLTSQFKPLPGIWNACIEDLIGYSRAKAKAQGTSEGMKAYLALPSDLRTGVVHPLAKSWDEILAGARPGKDCCLIDVGHAVQLIDIPQREKLTPKQSRDLAQAIESLGFVVEPDARYDSPYAWDQELAVFKPADSKIMAPSPNYLGASILMKLCVLVAGADGHVAPEELNVSRRFVEQKIRINPEDHRRLEALEQVLIADPNRVSSSLARIARPVPKEQRELICELLVYVAAADSIVTKDEIRTLERIFKAFELPPERLEAYLKSISPELGEVTIQPGGSRVPGDPIPRPGQPFHIDMSRVDRIAQETSEVIGILSKVMAEEESESEESDHNGKTLTVRVSNASAVPEANRQSNATPEWLRTLEPKYRPVLLQLLERDSWTRPDFDALAKKFQLMPLDAFDALNGWADENLGDFLLEGDDIILVHKRLIP
jgi:uncharacterized tellurite resistance protein B-like protein